MGSYLPVDMPILMLPEINMKIVTKKKGMCYEITQWILSKGIICIFIFSLFVNDNTSHLFLSQNRLRDILTFIHVQSESL